MDGREFYKMVGADADLQLASCVMGETPSQDFVDVRFLPLGGGTRISIREILSTPREQLRALLRFERPARIIRQYNRAGCSREHPACIRMLIRVARAA